MDPTDRDRRITEGLDRFMVWRRHRIPRWANVLCFAGVLVAIGVWLGMAVHASSDLTEMLGHLGNTASGVAMAAIAWAFVLYIIIVILDLARGEKPPVDDQDKKMNSHLGNIAP